MSIKKNTAAKKSVSKKSVSKNAEIEKVETPVVETEIVEEIVEEAGSDETLNDETPVVEKVVKPKSTRRDIFIKSLEASYLKTKNATVDGIAKKILTAFYDKDLELVKGTNVDKQETLEGTFFGKENPETKERSETIVVITKIAKGKSNRYVMNVGDKLDIAGGFASKLWRTFEGIGKSKTTVAKVFDKEAVSAVAALLDM